MWQRRRLGHLKSISRDVNSRRASGFLRYFSRWWWSRSFSGGGYSGAEGRAEVVAHRALVSDVAGYKKGAE